MMKEYWNSLTAAEKTKKILSALLVLMGLIFAIRNWQSTEVILVFFKIKMPLTLIIVLSGAAGYALSALFDYRKFKARDKEIKSLREQLTHSNKEA